MDTVTIIDFEVLSATIKQTRSFKAGDVIFRAGEQGNELFVVRSGEVDIQIGGRTVETVGANGVFGEMALVDAHPRSATAVARTDCVVVPVSERQFLLLVREAPYFALAVMRVLAQRLRAADLYLGR